MEQSIRIDDMPEHFFVKLFAVMFVGMAPLTCMSAIIAEEKEKNTLRALMAANVKPVQYLLGTGLYILAMCMAGTVVFSMIGGYRGADILYFDAAIIVGIIISILVGAVIGMLAHNQMSATSITVPVMMIFSFLPMLSMFNDTIKKFSKLIYSQQLNILINDDFRCNFDSIIVIIVNFILAAILFLVAYYKKGLE